MSCLVFRNAFHSLESLSKSGESVTSGCGFKKRSEVASGVMSFLWVGMEPRACRWLRSDSHLSFVLGWLSTFCRGQDLVFGASSCVPKDQQANVLIVNSTHGERGAEVKRECWRSSL